MSAAPTCGLNSWCEQSNLGQNWTDIEWDMMTDAWVSKSWQLRAKFDGSVHGLWPPFCCTYSSPISRLMVWSSCELNPWCEQSNLGQNWTDIEWDMTVHPPPGNKGHFRVILVIAHDVRQWSTYKGCSTLGKKDLLWFYFSRLPISKSTTYLLFRYFRYSYFTYR